MSNNLSYVEKFFKEGIGEELGKGEV